MRRQKTTEIERTTWRVTNGKKELARHLWSAKEDGEKTTEHGKQEQESEAETNKDRKMCSAQLAWSTEKNYISLELNSG